MMLWYANKRFVVRYSTSIIFFEKSVPFFHFQAHPCGLICSPTSQDFPIDHSVQGASDGLRDDQQNTPNDEGTSLRAGCVAEAEGAGMLQYRFEIYKIFSLCGWLSSMFWMTTLIRLNVAYSFAKMWIVAD